MKIIKNQKGFALPVIFLVVAIITTTGSYMIIRNNFQNQNKKEEKLIIKNNISNEEKEQDKKQKEKVKNENQISDKEKNKIQENEKKQDISSFKENKEKEELNNKEKNEEKNPDENKKINYVDQPHSGGFIYINNELQLSASTEENGVRLTWTRCNSDQFVAYKIARSDSASDVYYPRDGSIASISNQDSLTYFDNNLEKGKTYYYRICSLEKNGESWCGNVISISF